MIHARLSRFGCVVLWALLAALTALPAQACGCGAYIPREGDAHVAEERALVRWDGQNEDIVMQLSVAGESADAAWILPVPAEASVKLADARLFDALQELTKPLIVEQRVRGGDGATGGAAPGGAPPVTLLERQALGPFDVSTLAATDASALAGWLSSNGYLFPDGLETALEPYVDQEWMYVAVRLAPESGSALEGKLDPLWVSFASDELIYPMRASALAENPLPVYLYLLADHRAGPPAPWVADGDTLGLREPELQYADWIDPAALPADSPIAQFVPRKLFLTKYFIMIDEPSRIANDFVFPLAGDDTAFRATETRFVYVDEPALLENPLLWLLVAGLAAGLLALGVLTQRRSGAKNRKISANEGSTGHPVTPSSPRRYSRVSAPTTRAIIDGSHLHNLPPSR